MGKNWILKNVDNKTVLKNFLDENENKFDIYSEDKTDSDSYADFDTY